MRLVNGSAPAPLEQTAPWRADLQLVWEGEARPQVWLGGCPMPPGPSPLPLPSLAGELVARRGDALLRVKLSFADGARPPTEDEQLLRAWVALARHQPPRTGSALTALPVYAIEALNARMEPTPLDRLLSAQGRGAIARIAARPRSYIRSEDLRTPVERVSRPARDAERELSRSGDAILVGRRAIPSQLLCSFTEEEFDIYENRVLVTILKELAERARRRLQELTRTQQRISALREGLARLKAMGQHRRYGLLQRAATQAGRASWLDTVDERVEDLRRTLNEQLAGFDAALCRPVSLALRRAPPVIGQLRETNILTFDDDYRLLPKLWRALAAERQPTLDARADDPDGAYADLTEVALASALAEQGFTLPDTPASLWCTGGAADTTMCALGPEQAEGRWVARSERHRDAEGWRIDLDLDWRPRGRAAAPASAKRRRPGAEVSQGGGAHPDQPVHRLRLRPTFTYSEQACPQAATDAQRKLVWVHPLSQLPESDEAARARFNLQTEPQGNERALALALDPGDWASTDRMGRLIRRFTLWTDLVEGRVPEACPGCGGPSREENRGRSCSDRGTCGLRWGRRECSRCKAVIPKLLPPTPRSEALEDLLLQYHPVGRKRQLFAELGGRDMLADWPLLPELDPERDRCADLLACPACGDWPKSGPG